MTISISPLLVHGSSYNVTGIASQLSSGVKEDVVLPMQIRIVADIVERCAGTTTGHNWMICHVSRAASHAALDKDGLQLPLIPGRPHALEYRTMRLGRDGIGISDQTDFKVVLDHARLFNCGHELVKVDRVKGEKGDVVGNVVGEGVDGGFVCHGG